MGQTEHSESSGESRKREPSNSAESCESRKRDPRKALVIEDVRSAEVQLRKRNWSCDRLTHSEALSDSQGLTAKMRNKEYSLLWISTPAN